MVLQLRRLEVDPRVAALERGVAALRSQSEPKRAEWASRLKNGEMISIFKNGQSDSMLQSLRKMVLVMPKRSKNGCWILEFWLFMIVPSKPWVCTVHIFKISIKSCCQVVDKTTCHPTWWMPSSWPRLVPNSWSKPRWQSRISNLVLAWSNGERNTVLESLWRDTAWAALSLSSDLGRHQNESRQNKF